MESKEIKIASLDAIGAAAQEFIDAMGDFSVFAFYGEMGAGKTTFINALCAEMGVEDVTNSPSFSIVNEYRSETTAELIYHFDFYRLEDEREAEDIGVDDYFESGAVCLIEWPERIDNLLPDHTVRVDIKPADDGSRTITLTFPD
ncbi:MAG: tRNA (adenosine(37)-N6)-threonylcarbamoyltransferase complex ATPase subunit type 1 TsaE [Muribaculaceae bacterium]